MRIFTVAIVVLVHLNSLADVKDNLHLDLESFTVKAHFKPHRKEHRLGSYLSMNLQFLAFSNLRNQVENYIGRTLNHRGEAHVTVITPPEFFDVLQKKLSIREIEAIAHKFGLQDSVVSATCVGKGTVVENEQKLETYFLVVESQNLLQIRREIHREFIARGGNRSDFDPEQFFPHVTLGFTMRDLYISDGVVKDKSSCWKDIRVSTKT